MSTIPAHLRSERATVVEPGRAAVASALALDSTVSLPASPALNPTGDTVKARRSTPDWGAALGLGAFDQQDLFQRAMARVFSDDPEASAAPRIGRFTILRRLGEGGMGVVFAAYDAELDRKVAIKLVRDEVGNLESKARLLREAQAMARLAHPNVVSVYDVGLHQEQIYVAMEFIKGQTLTAWIDERSGDWRAILGMFLKAGEGLAAAHDGGMVHRDFKPEDARVTAEHLQHPQHAASSLLRGSPALRAARGGAREHAGSGVSTGTLSVRRRSRRSASCWLASSFWIVSAWAATARAS